MADTKATVASGADPAGDIARRRNVPAPEAPAQQPQAEEQKIHGQKKVYIQGLLHILYFSMGHMTYENASRTRRSSIFLASGNSSLPL